MTKATMAREWLWFVGSLLVAVIAAAVVASDSAADPVSVAVVGLLVFFAVYVLGGFVRLTWWAVRAVRKSN